MLGNSLKHVNPPCARLVLQVMRNLNLFIGTAVFLIINDTFHSDKIDESGKNLTLTDRYLERNRICAQSLFNSLDSLKKVCSGSIHLIDIGNPRHTILICLAPYCFRLWLNTAYSTEKCNRTIKYPK